MENGALKAPNSAVNYGLVECGPPVVADRFGRSRTLCDIVRDLVSREADASLAGPGAGPALSVA